MSQITSIIQKAYSWKTVVLGLTIFIAAYIVTHYIFSAVGGCSGCVGDGEGGVDCVNECKSISPVILALGGYLIALLVTWRGN